MNTRTVIVLAVCALLFVSSIDCKKVKKNAKEVKAKKEKVVKVEEPVVEAAPEVHAEVVPEVHAETVVEEVPVAAAAQKHRLSPPKSLKVTSAYEQCKLECRKARDAVQAKDYVEQLRQELTVAEAALAAEVENAPVAEASAVAPEATQH
ncbi:unnamed protein product [Caenorhabditis angaria]|uniref:Uncharacterized protein n=1 Tax=Caenorhabditis angaria TaxID=860376 RepID=A0A9P1ITY0_9PELO|nr:unnamed protein product [Caenorhabditis angaria]